MSDLPLPPVYHVGRICTAKDDKGEPLLLALLPDGRAFGGPLCEAGAKALLNWLMTEMAIRGWLDVQG